MPSATFTSFLRSTWSCSSAKWSNWPWVIATTPKKLPFIARSWHTAGFRRRRSAAASQALHFLGILIAPRIKRLHPLAPGKVIRLLQLGFCAPEQHRQRLSGQPVAYVGRGKGVGPPVASHDLPLGVTLLESVQQEGHRVALREGHLPGGALVDVFDLRQQHMRLSSQSSQASMAATRRSRGFRRVCILL